MHIEIVYLLWTLRIWFDRWEISVKIELTRVIKKSTDENATKTISIQIYPE